MADGSDDPGDYRVGKNHPPLEGRVRKGEVRNPYGRKGKPKAFNRPKPEAAFAAFDKALSRTVKARGADGSTIKMSAKEAFFTSLLNDALAKDPRARRLVASLLRDLEKTKPKADQIPSGVVVISQPPRNKEEWFARVRAYQDSLKGKDRFEGVPGYDRETSTYQGIPVNPETGEFVKPCNARSRGLSDSYQGDDEEDDIAKAQRAIAAGKTATDERTGWRGRAIVTGGAGVARSSIMSLSACLSWAVDQEIIAANPVSRVKKLPKRTMERFLSEIEAARLLETLAEMEADGSLLPVHGDCVRVLLLTGARRGEIAGLRWNEVDLARGVLTLSADRHKAGGSAGKKHIVINAPAAQIIAQRTRMGAAVFAAPSNPDEGCDAGLAKAWERVRARADLPGVRLHDLRHSFASFGAAGGASLLLIGKALGHSQAATTARYAHLGHDPVRDLAERIGERIMGARAAPEASANVVTLPAAGRVKGRD